MKNILIKISLSLSLVLLATVLFANDASVGQVVAQASFMDWAFEHVVFIVGGLIIFGAFLGVIRLNNQLLDLQKIKLFEEHGIETMEKLNLTKKESFWGRWVKEQTKVVAIENEEDVMLDHEYDGIRELDNILPPWWVSLFNITIVIAVVYFGYYEVTGYGQTQAEEWETEMAEAKIAVKAYIDSQPNMIDENSVVLLEGEGDLAAGKEIYTTNCTVCHGDGGEGGVGPNFADEYWLHGGGIKNIFKTVKYGVPEKGMIAWKSSLKAADMQKVSSYILTFQGTDPENGKEAEGDLWEPESE